MDVGARAAELAGPLEMFPPVDFCCAYGSSLLPNNDNKSAMVDYILGVAEPVQWHAEITRVADGIGVGVHFNPFVQWKDKMIKYGVVGMQELARDLLAWDRFYLSGRLQKPVRILVDNYDIEKVNAVNLKAATSAALLLSSPEFTEEELYSKICSLSYMGDLRMLFAEDKNKVNKIVKGSFGSFHKMYKPFIAEYITDGLLKSSTNGPQKAFEQDCGLSASQSLFSSLPWTIRAGLKTAEKVTRDAGGAIPQVAVSSRQEAINCTRRVLRRLVMVSSARQAVSGVLAAGGVNAVRYLGKKMCRAWRSRVP
ncbi:hypothetical protein Taro_029499 [Colocasia esculenta]|uniref:Phosphatidate cytidylyltransferase, mitochondrial n=1 Tax=Colocasia esculenta TaxID=4460 RepID=A0A843VTF4_COLES|nr:hypothetical protein [Colocasia esculenta]